MALSDRGIFERSPPARVIFAGLEGYTPTMEANGWEFYLEREPDNGYMRSRFMMTMRHRPSGCVMFSQGMVDGFRRAALEGFGRDDIEFVVNRVAHERHTEIVMDNTLVPNFERVSMMPSYDDVVKMGRVRLADLFTQWAPEAQEIIVEPKTVEALMAEIRSLQQPELAEIRRRAYVRDSRPQQDQMVAQIIAFAA